MKCQELQIWDWITDGNRFPMQITNVGDDYAYATFEGNEGDPWEFDDKVDKPQPIEITDDILMKNNWEKYNYYLPYNRHKYYYVKDEGGNHLQWRDGTLSIWFAHGETIDIVFSDVVLPCKYVHQLQGALRLAGLNEMANNFKV